MDFRTFNNRNLMKRVLFAEKNSRRSHMAEGFATLGEGKIAVTSSGLEASQVDPITVQVMSESGIDISDQTSKPLTISIPNYDAVISLCGCGVNLPQGVLRVFQDWQLDGQRAINRNLSPGEK